MERDCYVGFDTSNYTTSAAVCSGGGEILANIRIPLPVREGERGLRQSDAVFFHNRNLPAVCRELREAVRGLEVRAVGCSVRPRNAEGSYMPCFLAGQAAAEAFAAARNLPVYACSHQEGHIMAALYSAGEAERLLRAPFVAFHVSGGTTEAVYAVPQEGRFRVELLGGSADLHAGQAIDRAGVMMGIPFPCGKEMEALAAQNRKPVPVPKVSVRDGVCHFSGLENLAQKLWRETGDRALVSAFVLEFCARTLKGLTDYAETRKPGVPVVYAGGVMSNRYLQSVLAHTARYFAEPQFSADNAAGTALLCRMRARAKDAEKEDANERRERNGTAAGAVGHTAQ